METDRWFTTCSTAMQILFTVRKHGYKGAQLNQWGAFMREKYMQQMFIQVC